MQEMSPVDVDIRGRTEAGWAYQYAMDKISLAYSTWPKIKRGLLGKMLSHLSHSGIVGFTGLKDDDQI